MDQYVIYLRKSRADIEAEQRGEGETLARHEKELRALAKRQNLNVVNVYPEIESADTIADRPYMVRLLREVENGLWTGVIVMAVDRLARGDTKDQGIVAQTFKYSSTKIVTPAKTYDPNNEFDEEYFEFGLFMSRREYKTINRRLQRGRLASVNEGKYVANQPPYGYVRKKLNHEKGYTLEPFPAQAEVVKMIFDLYTNGVKQDDGTYMRIGISKICRRLNDMNIKPQKGDAWVLSSIRDILINPVYIGKIRWNWRPANKKMVNGNVEIERPRNSKLILTDGLHPAIIKDDVFNLAQQIISSNPSSPVTERSTIQNPLAGLIVCSKCGRKMIRKINRKGPDTLMCPATHCDNISSALIYIEEELLKSLQTYISVTKVNVKELKKQDNTSPSKVFESQKEKLDLEIAELKLKLKKIYGFVEDGTYNAVMFHERYNEVTEQLQIVQEKRNAINNLSQKETNKANNLVELIPMIENVVNIYHTLPTAQAKNNILKEVLIKVLYSKNKSGHFKGNNPRDFELQLYPKFIENNNR